MFYDLDYDKHLEDDACAAMPNMVNSLVNSSKIIIAQPFGPKDPNGNDVFEEKVKAALSLTEEFIDDWDTYHYMGGEVHCGTNATRNPPGTDWW